MLVGPGGQSALIMSDAGGGLDVVNVNLTFDDAAAAGLPDATQIISGTFQPTNFDTTTDVFPAPAPVPGGSALSVFNGTNPNGTWSLYVRDDLGADFGSISSGWALHLITSGCGTTAASASISGRVMTASGQGIRNATVVVTGNSLAEPRIAQTGSFGWFTFDGLQTGETYVVTVNSRRFTFSAPSRVISLVDNVVDADFIADPQE